MSKRLEQLLKKRKDLSAQIQKIIDGGDFLSSGDREGGFSSSGKPNSFSLSSGDREGGLSSSGKPNSCSI